MDNTYTHIKLLEEQVKNLGINIDYYIEQINYLYNLIDKDAYDLKDAQHRLEHWYDANSNLIKEK